MISITDSNFPTVDSRMEVFLSWKDHLANFIKRNQPLDKDANIIAVLNRPDGKEWFYTHNIATDIADQFYAEKAVGDTPTNDFLNANNRCELGNDSTPDPIAKGDTYSDLDIPITASRQTITATYPKVSDDDTDNTGGGADIVSWDYGWTISDFDTDAANNVQAGVIHLGGASPVGGTVLLSHYNFSVSFEKTSDDTLKVFHNHRMNGV